MASLEAISWPSKSGDLAAVAVPDRYRLIFVAWNSLFNLLTQEDQLRCFENVAAHLTDDGCFVVEVRIGVLRHDPSTQTLEQSHISLSSDGVSLNPVVQRYAWPSELDLMGRIAGLRLRERWADWEERPFNSSSEAHVSVYGR